MKLCMFCKHFLPDDRCAMSPKPINFVTGEPQGYYPAQVERETMRGCTPTGNFFEPKVAA